MGLEYLQRRRLRNLPGQPVPVLRHPQREEILPHVQLELPLLQFVPVAPCPVAGHHWKEFGPILLMPTLEIFIGIYKVPKKYTPGILVLPMEIWIYSVKISYSLLLFTSNLIPAWFHVWAVSRPVPHRLLEVRAIRGPQLRWVVTALTALRRWAWPPSLWAVRAWEGDSGFVIRHHKAKVSKADWLIPFLVTQYMLSFSWVDK